ncbi:MAG: hypothetical protein ACLFP6_12640 [Spirochaetaceae bacterium]
MLGHFIHPVHWFMPFVYRSECFYQVLVTAVVEERARSFKEKLSELTEEERDRLARRWSRKGG